MNSYPLSVSNTERGQVYMENVKAKKSKHRFDRQDYFTKILFRHELGKNEYYYVEYFNKKTGIPFEKHYKTIYEMSADIDRYRPYNNIFVSRRCRI